MSEEDAELLVLDNVYILFRRSISIRARLTQYVGVKLFQLGG